MLLISMGMMAKNTNDANEESGEAWYTIPKTTMTRRAWIQVSIGVTLVTFFTPALTNYALFQIALALMLTLTSVGPLYALPLSWILQKEKPTVRACLGAIFAVVGVIVLSFFGIVER